MAEAKVAEKRERRTKPADMGNDQWTLERITGNVAMAQAIVDTDSGPNGSDPAALADFLVVSKDAEKRALKKLTDHLMKVEPTTKALREEFEAHAARSSRLYQAITGVRIDNGRSAVNDTTGGVQAG